MQLVIVALAVLLAACGDSKTGPPQTGPLRGTMSLSGGADEIVYRRPAKDGGECVGRGGYSDLKPGAQVTVRDEAGTIIATGRVTGSRLTEVRAFEGRLFSGACRLAFTVDDVPRQEVAFYSVEVSGRGELQYSREELAAQDWMVEMTIGD